ncbi:BTAD domain-containing putative transcriptional regulator [Pseudaestuariivita sp.]|uniref:BTAD domain-containing putative transcriptional regulator n=1 Tax=Pseudaestuariivita sp. TaxID=2211669 RepID=UPI0040599BD4
MASSVTLSLIGAARAETDGGRDVTARRALAVLAMIAVGGGQPVPRELVAATIWSGVDDTRARASLRQTLAEIKSINPSVLAVLAATRHAIGMDTGRVNCDVLRFFAAAESADIAGLRLIPANLGTQFLYGFEDLGDGFAEWLTDTRADIVTRLTATLEQAFDLPDITRDQRRALAEACLRLSPMNERAARVGMHTLAEQGDIAQALELYGRVYRLMDETLGMEPSDETQDLAVAIKQSQSSGDFPVATAPARSIGAYGQPVLAVLPMTTFGQDVETRQLGEMFVEDVVCSLASCRDLPTLSNASTRNMAETDDTLPLLRDRYGVSYVLRTTLRRAAGKCRVTTQLVGSESGLAVWGNTFDTDDAALMGLQAEIASKVVAALVPKIHANEFDAVVRHDMADLSAYQMLLKARHLTYKLDRDALDEADALLSACTEANPGFVQAHVARAETHSIRIGQSWSTDAQGDLAGIKASLDEALRLNPRDARAMAMRGHNIGIYERAYDQATKVFDRAIEALPNDAETLVWSAPVLAYSEAAASAIKNAEKAISLSPEDPMMFRYEHFAAISHFAAGQYEEAAHYGLASTQRNPRYTSNLRVTMGALAALDRHDEITPLRSLHRSINPDFRVRDFVEWQAFATPERRTEFGALLTKAGLPA